MADIRIIARDRSDMLGEGLLWSPRDDAVYWVDILGRRINRLRLADDSVASWEMPDVVGWLIERERGGFVVGLGRAVVGLTLDPFAITPLADLPDEPAENRVNDAKADAAGRIWLGTMPFACDRPSGSFYRLDHDHGVTRVAGDYTIPNGPAIAPDGRWLLHTDTAKRKIYEYAIFDDGTIGPGITWLDFREEWGSPDGMTFDAEGGLWVACWGAGCVRRFTPQGELDCTIDLPTSQISNVAFAGPKLDRMFVTSAAKGIDEEHGGALFEVDPGCRGLAPHVYRG